MCGRVKCVQVFSQKSMICLKEIVVFLQNRPPSAGGRLIKCVEICFQNRLRGRLKGLSPRWVPTRKKSLFFFLDQNFASFFWKVFNFFAKKRSTRDLFKNGVLDQNFDFRSPHTPPTLGNFQIFGELPLISHCKLHWICPKLTKSGTPLGRTPLKSVAPAVQSRLSRKVLSAVC